MLFPGDGTVAEAVIDGALAHAASRVPSQTPCPVPKTVAVPLIEVNIVPVAVLVVPGDARFSISSCLVQYVNRAPSIIKNNKNEKNNF